MNTLYTGEGLQIVRDRITDSSVDLVYADPPCYPEAFALPSDGDLFRNGASSAAWHAFGEVLPEPLAHYCATLTAHLREWFRVLKSSGSLYLHCSTETAVYVRFSAQSVFGTRAFRNEIVWRNRGVQNSNIHRPNHWPVTTERILYFAKSNDTQLKPAYVPLSEESTRESYKHVDEKGRFRLETLLDSRPEFRPMRTYSFRGFDRQWKYSQERMLQFEMAGQVYQESTKALPRLKKYASDFKGSLVGDLWEDIPLLSGSSSEHVAYPQQKPLKLAERIIETSTPPNGVVLDPFCGSGTTLVAAQKLGRNWTGVDANPEAISLARYRITSQFPDVSLSVAGEPRSMSDITVLAQLDWRQFESWVIGRLGWMPSVDSEDKGFDGKIAFFDDPGSVLPHYAVVEVKRTSPTLDAIRQLRTFLNGDRIVIGVVVAFSEPNSDAIEIMNEAGHYQSLNGSTHPRLQWITVTDLLDGKRPDIPIAKSTTP